VVIYDSYRIKVEVWQYRWTIDVGQRRDYDSSLNG
jgi:hypothetical protein